MEMNKGATTEAVTPLYYWCRGTESNCRHGDFQSQFRSFQKEHNFNVLIMLDNFSAFLVILGKI